MCATFWNMKDTLNSAQELLLLTPYNATLKKNVESVIENIDINPYKKQKEPIEIFSHEIDKLIQNNGGEISVEKVDILFEKIDAATLQRKIDGTKKEIEDVIQRSLQDPEKEADTKEIRRDPSISEDVHLEMLTYHKDFFSVDITPDGKTVQIYHNGFFDVLDQDYLRDIILYSPKTKHIKAIEFITENPFQFN